MYVDLYVYYIESVRRKIVKLKKTINYIRLLHMYCTSFLNTFFRKDMNRNSNKGS